MSYLGWVLAFFGFLGLIGGLLQMLKGKKMNAVPFRAPAQIASMGQGAADAKGLVSTEGSVPPQGVLVAPMSGKPCLAFEITVERKWEKSEVTEKGTETKTGSEKVFSDYRGGIFPLQDGQGTVFVDASEKPDVDMDKAHNSKTKVFGVIPGTLQFGNFQLNTPAITDRDTRTTGYEGTEKILEPSPTLYALGALAMGAEGPVLHTPKGIGTGKLILSKKGRAALVKSTKTKMIVAYSVGGLLSVGGTVLGIFGPAPDPSVAGASCPSTITADVAACEDRMYEKEGKDFSWTITTAGEYAVTATAPKVKIPVTPVIVIKNDKGVEVAHNDDALIKNESKIVKRFEPGTYTINVHDFSNSKIKGGFGFSLSVAKSPDAPAVASATVTSSDISDAGAVAAKPAVKAAIGGVKPKPGASAAKPAAPGSAAPKPAASAAPAASVKPKN